MKTQFGQSSTSTLRFDVAQTTADTGNLAALMTNGMLYLGSVFHDAGITRIESQSEHQPFEPVATDD